MTALRGIVAGFARVALIAGCGGAPAPVPLRETLAGGEAGPVAFASTNPYDFVQMIDGSAEPARVTGVLRLPPEGVTPRSAVILSHGAGGPGARQERYAVALAEAGHATLMLDHFGPRGLSSTVRDQLRATEQSMVADVFAARALLRSHPALADKPVGLIGWSKGGTVATLASVDRLAGYATGRDAAGSRLDFAIAFYPFCGFALDGERLATPLLYLLAENDDWTPPGPCLRQVEAWQAAGEPVTAVVFDDADHGFDSRLWLSVPVPPAITVRDTSDACTLTVDADGGSVTQDGALSVGTLAGRTAFLEACGVRGVTFGGQGAARRAARDAVTDFIESALR
jgi:dienelactone hydrolase